MTPQIISFYVVAVSVLSVLSAPVPHAWEIRHYALVRRGKLPLAGEKSSVLRPPGWYENPAKCGYKNCLNGHGSFVRPGTVDRHWTEWHGGAIPARWEEPVTMPEPGSGLGPVRTLPLGEDTRSILTTQRLNEKFPAEARRVKEQRMSRKLFTAHLHGADPAMPLAAIAGQRRVGPRTEVQKQRRKDLETAWRLVPDPEPSAGQIVLNRQLVARRRAQEQIRRRRYLAKQALHASTQQAALPVDHQLEHPDNFQPQDHGRHLPGPSTEQAAHPVDHQLEHPLNFQPQDHGRHFLPGPCVTPCCLAEVITKAVVATERAAHPVDHQLEHPVNFRHEDHGRHLPGPSTQQAAAPSASRQLRTFQPVTFTHSALSSFHSVQDNIRRPFPPMHQEAAPHMYLNHAPEQPRTQPRRRRLNIDLNYPPEQQPSVNDLWFTAWNN